MPKETESIRKGSSIEVKNSFTGTWETKTVTKVSDHFIWFNGSGACRIRKTTFITWPSLYRIKPN